MNDERIIDGDAQVGDMRDKALRPLSFDDFVGQKAAISNLKVFVEAAGRRGEALDHLLLSGPPGLGKTTLAQIVARELGVNFRVYFWASDFKGRGFGGTFDQFGTA